MLETREKAEIRTSATALMHLRRFAYARLVPITEALSSFGFQYLSETYLPRKLQEVRSGLADRRSRRR